MRQGWKELFSLQIGSVVCLPLFAVGHLLAREYGVMAASTALLVGNFLLLLLALFLGKKAAVERRSSSEYAELIFGPLGAHFFSAILIVVMLGWFALQLQMIEEAMTQLMHWSPAPWHVLVIGAAMTSLGAYGMKGLLFLADWSLPLFGVTLLLCFLLRNWEPGVTIELSTPFSLPALSLVIAASIGVVVDLPTFFRHARDGRSASVALTLLFGVSLPLLQGVGVLLFYQGASDSLLSTLDGISSALPWKLWVALFVLLAGWTTNNANLYSAAANSRALFPEGCGERSRFLFLGLMGSCLSLLPLFDRFTLALELMGVAIASFGALLFIHLLSSYRAGESMAATEATSSAWMNVGIWMTGILLSLVGSYWKVPLCSQPTCSSFLWTLFLSYTYSCTRLLGKRYVKTYA